MQYFMIIKVISIIAIIGGAIWMARRTTQLPPDFHERRVRNAVKERGGRVVDLTEQRPKRREKPIFRYDLVIEDDAGQQHAATVRSQQWLPLDWETDLTQLLPQPQ